LIWFVNLILSFRKPFLSFYIYLLLIWLFRFIFIFFMLLSNDRTSLLQNSWDCYLFGSAGISVDLIGQNRLNG
jgi:hypothetical protein